MALLIDRDPAPAPQSAPAAAGEPVARRSGPGWVLRALAVVAVVAYVAIGLWQAKHDAANVDEAVDVSSGLATVVRHDLRLNPEHAPLPKVLSALPALFAHPIVPDSTAWRDGDWFDFTDDFMRANTEAGRLDEVLFLARLVPLAEGLAAAWLIYVLGRGIFNPSAGAVGALLWLTTPLVVGLSHFAGIDMPYALATLWFSHRVLCFFDSPRLKMATWLGVACAVALLTRHSALVLWAYAAIAVFAVVWRTDRRLALRCAGVVIATGLVGVWIVMRALAPSGPTAEMAARTDALVSQASDKSLSGAVSLAVPFPAEYRAGLAYLVVTSDERPAYLFGDAWMGSRWWFFPAGLVAKLPLGALGALVLVPLCARRGRSRTRQRVVVALVGPAAVSFVFLLAQPLNLGVRYVMGPLALTMVVAGAAVRSLTLHRRRLLGAVLVAAQAWAMVGAAQHALAWTSPLFQPAYRWVSDSNLDYGQDYGLVQTWAADHPDAWVSLLRPRGVDNPAGTRELRDADPSTVTGWVAVSATRLTVLNRDELAWLRPYCPVANLGGSVLIYRFANAPASASSIAATGMGAMPAAPCWGADASTLR